MAVRKLVLYPDPRLKEQCDDVTAFDGELHALLADMAETMVAAVGVGLAAPQIGVLKRVAVVDVSEEQNNPIELINPTIVTRSGKVTSEEGCLSIPGYRDTIPRSANVMVKAQNRHGEWFEIGGDGLLAMCLQHELDHLNGVLFVDHLSRIKREVFRRWVTKQGGVLTPER